MLPCSHAGASIQSDLSRESALVARVGNKRKRHGINKMDESDASGEEDDGADSLTESEDEGSGMDSDGS